MTPYPIVVDTGHWHVPQITRFLIDVLCQIMDFIRKQRAQPEHDPNTQVP